MTVQQEHWCSFCLVMTELSCRLGTLHLSWLVITCHCIKCDQWFTVWVQIKSHVSFSAVSLTLALTNRSSYLPEIRSLIFVWTCHEFQRDWSWWTWNGVVKPTAVLLSTSRNTTGSLPGIYYLLFLPIRVKHEGTHFVLQIKLAGLALSIWLCVLKRSAFSPLII